MVSFWPKASIHQVDERSAAMCSQGAAQGDKNMSNNKTNSK